MTRWELFLRGCVMPSLVTCNVTAVSSGAWPLVLVTSFGISFVWAGSVRAIASSMSTIWDRLAYAGGAGVGGVVGMVVGRWLA
jgi:hypothetical protein